MNDKIKQLRENYNRSGVKFDLNELAKDLGTISPEYRERNRTRRINSLRKLRKATSELVQAGMERDARTVRIKTLGYGLAGAGSGTALGLALAKSRNKSKMKYGLIGGVAGGSAGALLGNRLTRKNTRSTFKKRYFDE